MTVLAMPLKAFTLNRWRFASLILVANLLLLTALTTGAVQLYLQNERLKITNHISELETRFLQLSNKLLQGQPNFSADKNQLNLEINSWLLDLANLPMVYRAFLIIEDGTYYAAHAGNPQQGFIVTQDDSDHASIPKSMLYQPYWRHYFLNRIDLESHLWPSIDNNQYLTYTTPITIHQQTYLLAVDIEQQQWLPYTMPPHRAALYFLQQPISSELIGPDLFSLSFNFDTEWQFRYAISPPWLRFASYAILLLGLQLLGLYILCVRPSAGNESLQLSYQSLCDELSLMIVQLTPEGIVSKLYGSQPLEVSLLNLTVGSSILHVLSDQPRYLAYLQHSLSGEPLTFEIHEAPFTFRVQQRPILNDDGSLQCLYLYIQEITEQRELELSLQRQQNHDSLTGLPNRHYFNEQLQHDLELAKRRREGAALLALEISGLNLINRNYGHDIADEILRNAMLNVRSLIKQGDTLCRFSDDEFILSLSEKHTPHTLRNIAEQLIQTVTKPVVLNGKSLQLTANVGIATYPRDAKDAGSLISNAISAARHARRTDKNSLDYFSFDDALQAQEKWQLEQDLSKALTLDEFALHFQPIFNLTTNQCIGAEALIRWPNSQLEPEDFLPLAEERGLIRPIGLWVIEHTLMQLHEWKKQSPTLQFLSINLSGYQLDDEFFFQKLEQVIKRFPFNPGEIVLEISEPLLMTSALVTASRLNKLHSLGFHLAVDDFGTGFSSLHHLNHLPIQILKVDQSFTQNVPKDAHNTTICEAIINMAHALGLTIIAEGVETPQQMHWFSRHGVNSAQGYFYAKALSAEEFAPYLSIGRPT